MTRRKMVWTWIHLMGLCLSVATVSYSAQARPERGHSRNTSSELPAEVRAAIGQIHGLHRPRTATELAPEDQRLYELERSTRRLEALLLDVIERDNFSERGDTLATIEAEWAKWQQLKREHTLTRSERSGKGAARRKAEVQQRLEPLERAIAREVETAERVHRAEDQHWRDIARRDLRARLARSPSWIAERFPPSMLSVVVSAPTENTLAGTEGTAVTGTGSTDEPIDPVAEERGILRWSEYKVLLDESGLDYSTDDPAHAGRSFLSPDAAPGQTEEGTR